MDRKLFRKLSMIRKDVDFRIIFTFLVGFVFLCFIIKWVYDLFNKFFI